MGLEWKRPSEMGEGWPTKPSLFGSLGQPAPQGVAQQGLADCWFLAAASAMAEDPNRIYKVMEDSEYNDAGIFRFKFWVENKWIPINVDDRLPARSWGSGYRPWATSMSVNGAMWMPLLEKAYAKFNQNYDRIAWGWGSEGLRTLSGMPTATLYHDGESMSTMYSIH